MPLVVLFSPDDYATTGKCFGVEWLLVHLSPVFGVYGAELTHALLEFVVCSVSKC